MPLRIAQVIAGGNAIADFPYVYGGGHGSFIARAYDCSGSVSYALAAAGLIGAPETSGQLEHWGVPGPGRYLTVFANAGHTFMVVDGVWFDTAGRAGPYTTRWLTSRPVAGRVRDPPLPGSVEGSVRAPSPRSAHAPTGRGVHAPPGNTFPAQPRSSPLITAPATPPAAASFATRRRPRLRRDPRTSSGSRGGRGR